MIRAADKMKYFWTRLDISINPIALRKAKIVLVYNFGLTGCNRAKNCIQFWPF